MPVEIPPPRETLKEHLRRMEEMEACIRALQERIRKGDLYPDLMRDLRVVLGEYINPHIKSSPVVGRK